MEVVSRLIIFLFVVWVAFRYTTRRMRRTVVGWNMSMQHEVVEYEMRDGVMVVTKSRPISVSPVPVTQWDVFCGFVHALQHNARKHPKLMARAILNVLRRPR